MAELLRYTQEWHHQQQDIHPSDYIEEIADHNEIAELSSNLLALFKEIVLALSKQINVPRDAQISIERSYSALTLWSDGFGIAQGRLNDTFNKSRKLRYTALKNLSHIGRVLVERLVPAVNISSEKLKRLCSSVELNIEAAAGLIAEESCRQSDDSSSDAASNFSDDDIYEIAEDLKTDTLVLSGLDPLFKYPIFDSQHEHIIESQGLPIWGPEKSYSDKIGNRFPRADVSLTLYLGRANYERFLRCQEARESQEEEEEEPLAIVNQAEGTQAGTIIANTKFHDSGVGTSIGLTMSYAETTMSYNHDGQSVRIPPLPKEAKTGAPFTCIVCGRTVIITNNSAWKQHIYLDLRPYMCLDLSCPYSNSTFENRDNWLSHLALDHEMGPEWVSTECPLCKEETGNGKIAITKHLSKHLEEISLSALPVEVDSDAESENSLESSDANSSRNEETYGGIEENGETLSVEFEAELASTVFSLLKDKVKAERNHKAQSEARGALQRAAEILAAREAENMVAQLKKTQENIEDMLRKKEKSKMAELAPIKFKDAVGREFGFPVHLCNTWQGLDDLIQQAFSQVDVLGPHVQEGHYDLTDPDGNIILPSLWEELVEPGLHITMNLWPLDKAPVTGLDPKESERPHEEEGSSEKDNSFQNNIPSKKTQQQQEAQHSENVQGARIIRMRGQTFFSTAKAYFKDQPDKFTRFRVILADIATTEWVPEAWRRSCFECRMVEAECDAKAPDPCTRCRLRKLSCAVQFAAVSRQHTVVNGDQIRQGIINIGRLCGGYPSFMHELNSVMPTGYRVEVLDASTVRFFEPDNEPVILQVDMSRHSTTGLDNQAGLDMGPNQQGKSIPEVPNRPTLNQNSSEAATTQQKETSHYFAQPTESESIDVSELAHAALNKATVSAHIRSKSVPLSHAVDEAKSLKFGTWGLGPKGVSEDWDEDLEFGDSDNRNEGAVESYVDKIEKRFSGNPHKTSQLLEILQDAQNGTRSTENAYMVAKELFGLKSDLMDEFQRELTKLDVDLLQRPGKALKEGYEAPKEAVETKGDNIRTREAVTSAKDKNDPNDSNEPQYCLCKKGSAGIMIRCDNVDSCKYKWFHLECVGLAVAPSSKERWYCPDCRGHVNIGAKEEINSQGPSPNLENLVFAINTETSSMESSEIRNPANTERRGPVEFSHAIIYVNKIKNRFQDKPEIYKQFLDILRNFLRERKSNQDVYAEVATLFNSAPDLLEDFTHFLPESASEARAPPSRPDDGAVAGSDTEANLLYLGGLAKFHEQRGNHLNRLPYVDKKPVDLYRLKNLVESRGGFDKVCKSKQWAEIGKDLGYSGKIMSSLSTSLKNSFLRWLSPYEDYLRLAKPGVQQQLEQEHVGTGSREKTPSIGRINYPFPNPDIFIWPPGSNVPGEEESGPAPSSTAAPPLPPSVTAATDPITDREKGYNAFELSSSPSDRPEISNREYPDHKPFLARPRPDIYTKQLPPPISGVSKGGNSTEVDSFEEFSSLQEASLDPSSSIEPEDPFHFWDVTLQCEAEPQEKRVCLKRFASVTERNRHYWVTHKEYAEERGIQAPVGECKCTTCGENFTRQDNLRRHIQRHHSCTECRRRKQKCDQGQPCSNCIRRFPQPSCKYNIKPRLDIDKYRSPGDTSSTASTKNKTTSYQTDRRGIRCVCGKNEHDEENGYMVQCESCEMLLHGKCVNRSDAMPRGYICSFCANTPNVAARQA